MSAIAADGVSVWVSSFLALIAGLSSSNFVLWDRRKRRGRARAPSPSLSRRHIYPVGSGEPFIEVPMLSRRGGRVSGRGERDISGLICGIARNVAKRTPDFSRINGSSPE